MSDSQCMQILRHLAQGYTITPIEALEKFQCFALSQRITDLKKQRWPITTEMIRLKSGKRVAMYRLPVAEQVVA
jgi:hypothetical protein